MHNYRPAFVRLSIFFWSALLGRCNANGIYIPEIPGQAAVPVTSIGFEQMKERLARLSINRMELKPAEKSDKPVLRSSKLNF
jgi:hypothetical protein